MKKVAKNLDPLNENFSKPVRLYVCPEYDRVNVPIDKRKIFN